MIEQDTLPEFDANDLEDFSLSKCAGRPSSFHIYDVARVVPELIEDLSRFEVSSSISPLSGLLTEPDFC